MSDLQSAANEDNRVTAFQIPAEIANANNNGAQDSSKGPGTINVTLWLTCPSILTFIQNETPALHAHLSDEDKADLKSFVADRLKANGHHGVSNFGEFLFENSLSITKALFMPVLEAAYNRSDYSAIQKLQLAGELEKLKKQADIDVLIQKRADTMAAKAGIGMIYGKPVYGPRRLEDSNDEDKVPLALTFYLSKGGLDGMRQAMNKE